MKAIFIYAAIYVALFITHIYAAANDFDLFFRIVAALISIQTMFAGLCLHFLGGNLEHARIPVLVLAAGLGWAYAGMNENWTIILWVAAAVLIQYLTERGLKYGPLTQPTDG